MKNCHDWVNCCNTVQEENMRTSSLLECPAMVDVNEGGLSRDVVGNCPLKCGVGAPLIGRPFGSLELLEQKS